MENRWNVARALAFHKKSCNSCCDIGGMQVEEILGRGSHSNKNRIWILSQLDNYYTKPQLCSSKVAGEYDLHYRF